MAASRVPKACGEQKPQNPSHVVSSFGQTRHHHPRCRRATLRSAQAPLLPRLFYIAEAEVLNAVMVITKRLILRSVRFSTGFFVLFRIECNPASYMLVEFCKPSVALALRFAGRM
jgi:hypothetical protein